MGQTTYAPDVQESAYLLFELGKNDNPSEMNAATMSIIRVASWRASHINCRNVLGGFGGMMLEPNNSILLSMSSLKPRIPAGEIKPASCKLDAQKEDTK